jgi:hypothetical protein
VHNPDVRRLLAACLLIVFAALATADAFACPDGCQSACSQGDADHRNATGICVFCSGGAVPVPVPIAITPVVTQIPAPLSLTPAIPAASPAVLDHPPRVA